MEAKKKILCPVDFSEHSNQAFARACESALHSKAKLYILHVDGLKYNDTSRFLGVRG